MKDRLKELRRECSLKCTSEILTDIVEVAKSANELQRMNLEFYGQR